VLSAIQYITKQMYPPDLACKDELASAPDVLCDGGSAIVGPMGDYIAPPVRDREEIIYGDLDLSAIARSRFDFDVVGHYSRPDVFVLYVNEEAKASVKRTEGTCPTGQA